jgi:predicted membrane protein
VIQDVGKRGLEVNFYMSACHEGSDASPRDRLRSRLVGHEHTRHGCTLADTSILRSTQNEIVSMTKSTAQHPESLLFLQSITGRQDNKNPEI